MSQAAHVILAFSLVILGFLHVILRSGATKNLLDVSSAIGQLWILRSAAYEGMLLKHNPTLFLSRKGGHHTLREKR